MLTCSHTSTSMTHADMFAHVNINYLLFTNPTDDTTDTLSRYGRDALALLAAADGGMASPLPAAGIASTVVDGLPWAMSVLASIGASEGAITAAEAYVGGARSEPRAKALAVTRVVYAIALGYTEFLVNWRVYGNRRSCAKEVSLTGCPSELRTFAEDVVKHGGPAGAERGDVVCTGDGGGGGTTRGFASCSDLQKYVMRNSCNLGDASLSKLVELLPFLQGKLKKGRLDAADVVSYCLFVVETPTASVKKLQRLAERLRSLKGLCKTASREDGIPEVLHHHPLVAANATLRLLPRPAGYSGKDGQWWATHIQTCARRVVAYLQFSPSAVVVDSKWRAAFDVRVANAMDAGTSSDDSDSAE